MLGCSVQGVDALQLVDRALWGVGRRVVCDRATQREAPGSRRRKVNVRMEWQKVDGSAPFTAPGLPHTLGGVGGLTYGEPFAWRYSASA